MFAIGIRYLNGWAMAAADGARKQKAEWPPHPDRVFMALAAALFETGEEESERRALEWIESLPAPHLAATEAEERQAVTSYVPVNDPRVGRRTPDVDDLGKLKEAGLAVVPEHRTRQPRNFPVAIPRDPTVYLIWPDANADEHRPALNSLCRKVTHVGHSASLVQTWVEEDPPDASLRPEPVFGERRLRVPGPGRLSALGRSMNRAALLEYADLDGQFEKAKGKTKSDLKKKMEERFSGGAPATRRPEPGLWEGYTSLRTSLGGSRTPGTVFSPSLIVLALSGRRPGLRATLKLTAALRGALLANCPAPIPEWVSGHQPDGTPSRKPHMALFPLPFVGAPHADSRILGLALALPSGLSPGEAGPVVGRWLQDAEGTPRTIRLFDGDWLECDAALVDSPSPPVNLLPETWIGPPSRVWATVTPIVFDRHHDGRNRWEAAAETVGDACLRVGLPRPLTVDLTPVSPVSGTPASREFAPFPRKRGGHLQHSHAVVEFAEPVQGPVLLGAGRFRGYGVLRPLSVEEAARA